MGSSESGNTESYEAGHTEIFFLQMVVCESLLGRGRRFSANIVNKERSARTGRILQYPHPIRAVALKRLNCRVQNCARGSLRGRACTLPIWLFILRYCPVRARYFGGGYYVFKEYSDILTVSQVAKALGLGRNTVYQLVHTHQIGYKRIGTKSLYQRRA